MEVANIWVAAGDGDLSAVEAQVRAGVSVSAADENGYTPAHAAASWGHPHVLLWLLQHGANADARDADGDTPLHACEAPDCATMLLAAGAKLACENLNGETPFALAVADRRAEMIRWFEHMYATRGLTLPHVDPPEDADEVDETDDDISSGDGVSGRSASGNERPIGDDEEDGRGTIEAPASKRPRGGSSDPT